MVPVRNHFRYECFNVFDFLTECTQTKELYGTIIGLNLKTGVKVWYIFLDLTPALTLGVESDRLFGYMFKRYHQRNNSLFT